MTELINVNRKVELTDAEADELDDEIASREPFKSIDEVLNELRERIEDLEREFKKHDHKGGDMVIRKR